ncbi:MAG: sigma-70 family RNA polymerase sigma factor [Actinomycetota bacterium]
MRVAEERTASGGAGDAAAFRAVYRATLGDVYGYLLVHTGGNHAVAEDLTAETYLHAARQYREGSPEAVTGAWLKTVAKRRLIDHWRREERLSRRAQRLGHETLVNRQGHADRETDRLAIYEALGRLPDDQRLVLTLKHLDGLTVREIAEVMDRSPKAIETLLTRARKAFRATFDPTGGES